MDICSFTHYNAKVSKSHLFFGKKRIFIQKQQKKPPNGGLLGYILVAAAAQNEQRDDDDPAAIVITEEIADAVVVHTRSSLKAFGSGRFLSLAIILCGFL